MRRISERLETLEARQAVLTQAEVDRRWDAAWAALPEDDRAVLTGLARRVKSGVDSAEKAAQAGRESLDRWRECAKACGLDLTKKGEWRLL